MKVPTMAKLPGLFLRSGVYQLHLMVPMDLQAAFGGRTRLNESLATSDLRAATLKATRLRAEHLQAFADKRRELSPQQLTEVPPALTLELAQRVAANVLRRDDLMREDPAAAAALDSLHTLLEAPRAALKIAGNRL